MSAAPDGPPRVSVLIPVYQQATYLPRAIDSILTQTLTALELILVNDGSTDDSPAIIEEYARRDGRVRIAHQANAGISATLNHALSLARAEYVARLDGDDIALPDRLERQVAYLDKHPTIGLVGGAITLIDIAERKLRTKPYPNRPNDLRYLAAKRSITPGPSGTGRRDLLTAVGGWRSALDFSEDYDLALRILDKADVTNLSSVVTYYRLHHGQTSKVHRRRQKATSELARISARRRQAGLPDPVFPEYRLHSSTLDRLGLSEQESATLRDLLAKSESPG